MSDSVASRPAHGPGRELVERTDLEGDRDRVATTSVERQGREALRPRNVAQAGTARDARLPAGMACARLGRAAPPATDRAASYPPRLDLPMSARLVRLTCLAALALALPPHAQERDAELESLGRAVTAYLTAREEARGVDEARQAVVEQLETLRAADPTSEPLRRPELLREALRLARRLDPARLEKGRVRSASFAHGSFEGPGLELTYRLPKDYDPAENDYPLILAIPDHEESPAEHIRSHWMSPVVRQGAIVVSFPLRLEEAGQPRPASPCGARHRGERWAERPANRSDGEASDHR